MSKSLYSSGRDSETEIARLKRRTRRIGSSGLPPSSGAAALAANHAARHAEDGADELDVASLGSGAATAGQVPEADGAGGIDWISLSGEVTDIQFVIDGGGSALTTGIKGHLVVDFPCTVTGWTILGDQSGSAVVDVEHCTYANFPTTASIAGSEKPTLSSAQKNQDLALSTWTIALAAGDILEFEVESATTVTRVTVALKVTKA